MYACTLQVFIPRCGGHRNNNHSTLSTSRHTPTVPTAHLLLSLSLFALCRSSPSSTYLAPRVCAAAIATTHSFWRSWAGSPLCPSRTACA